MPFQIIRNDITKVACDVIVNTANPEPKFMAGTDSAVYRATMKEYLDTTGSGIKVLFNVFKDIDLLLYQNLLKYTDTLQAIEEGRRIADDPTIPGYKDAESLRSALETK